MAHLAAAAWTVPAQGTSPDGVPASVREGFEKVRSILHRTAIARAVCAFAMGLLVAFIQPFLILAAAICFIPAVLGTIHFRSNESLRETSCCFQPLRSIYCMRIVSIISSVWLFVTVVFSVQTFIGALSKDDENDSNSSSNNNDKAIRLSFSILTGLLALICFSIECSLFASLFPSLHDLYTQEIIALDVHQIRVGTRAQLLPGRVLSVERGEGSEEDAEMTELANAAPVARNPFEAPSHDNHRDTHGGGGNQLPQYYETQANPALYGQNSSFATASHTNRTNPNAALSRRNSQQLMSPEDRLQAANTSGSSASGPPAVLHSPPTNQLQLSNNTPSSLAPSSVVGYGMPSPAPLVHEPSPESKAKERLRQEQQEEAAKLQSEEQPRGGSPPPFLGADGDASPARGTVIVGEEGKEVFGEDQ